MFGKAQFISVDHEDHIACKVADACIGMCSDIIKKLMTCIGNSFHALSLLGCYSTDGRQNGRVNRTSLIEKCPLMISSMRLMHFFESGAVVSIVTVYTCAPNWWIGVALYGAYCGFNGAWCCYLRSALLM